MDGLAATYSKCERVVLGRAFAVPQAANRPCPTGTAACRRRLPFPARPLAFPALTHRVPDPGISTTLLFQGSPTFVDFPSV